MVHCPERSCRRRPSQTAVWSLAPSTGRWRSVKSRSVLLLLVHNIFIILLWCWKPSNLFCFEFTFVVFSPSSLLQNGRSSPCSPEHGGRLEVEGGYCCVYLPDGSASLAPTRNGQLIKDMLASLCEKRAFPLKDVVIYLNGKDKVRRARLLCTQHHLQPTQWKAVLHLAAARLFCDRNKWEIIIFCNYSNTFTGIFYISLSSDYLSAFWEDIKTLCSLFNSPSRWTRTAPSWETSRSLWSWGWHLRESPSWLLPSPPCLRDSGFLNITPKREATLAASQYILGL